MFGSTKCVKCESSSFKLEEIEMQGAAYNMMVAKCTSCKTPFGLTDFYNVGQLLKNQEKAVADLGKKIDGLEYTMGQIAHALQGMRR
jgi:predicted nucleic-acid-binding Zn-ribbon protein